MSSESEVEEEYMCGIGSWKPKWLQFFANPKAYLLNSCIQSVLQGAYFTYLIGVLSTLEKRYAFDSKISGIIMTSDNLSPVVIGILIGYYGGSVHRPRMIAAGMFISALGCVLMIIPYLMYGPALHLLSDASVIIQKPNLEICELHRKEHCESASSSGTPIAVTLIFIANFLNGVGSTAFYTIGTPYLDDNVKKKNSPMYFSFMFAMRMFGPAFGFMMASFCLQFYEDPTYDPGLTRNDPRFVGAWWLGFLILAVAIVLSSLPMLLFPRHMKKPQRQQNQGEQQAPVAKKSKDSLKDSVPKIKDLPKGLKRLAKNPVLVCQTLGLILRLNGCLGYYIFQPKYLEVQFRQTASGASLFTGAAGVATMLIGIMCGGYFMKRWKPRPRNLTGYIVSIEIVLIGTFVGITMVSCPNVQMPDTEKGENELILQNPCNSKCSCTTHIFQPVCGPDGKSSYFSPCFAGCETTSTSNETHNSKSFSNCTCVRNNGLQFSPGDVVEGFCDTNCQSFLVYILIVSVANMIASTGTVGGALITLRCVDPADKSLALGAMNVLIAVFAFIPHPLIYGALTDATCLVWERECGRTGNCWLYDVDKLRIYLHGVSIIFLVGGILFDVLVCLMADRIPDMYDETLEDDDPKKAAATQDTQTNEQNDAKKTVLLPILQINSDDKKTSNSTHF